MVFLQLLQPLLACRTPDHQHVCPHRSRPHAYKRLTDAEGEEPSERLKLKLKQEVSSAALHGEDEVAHRGPFTAASSSSCRR